MDPNSQRLIQGAAGAAGEKVYIEDVFSTWLYTGNNSTQTITNGIDLSGKGGLVWIKDRTNAVIHTLQDTARGSGNYLVSSSSQANNNVSDLITAFNSNGFSLGSRSWANDSTGNFASWTFRKQAKFFDVVTYAGNGSATQVVSHSLGSTPGCIIVKNTSTGGNWFVYHRSLGESARLLLNGTNASLSNNYWGTVGATSFTVKSDLALTDSGQTYVAYLFAHDAGGFGDSGNDSVVKCGSFTTDGSGNATVDLGWETQWVLVKRTDSTSDWFIYDSMRGAGWSDAVRLAANLSDTEASNTSFRKPQPTSFDWSGAASATYIYIAIRRGPMKTPTDATKVFTSISATGSPGTSRTTSFPVDMQFRRATGTLSSNRIYDRMRGVSVDSAGTGAELYTDSTSAEGTGVATTYNWWNTGYTENNTYNGLAAIAYNFRRAPGFFDAVCYTGTGVARTVSHNLGVAPELMIVKIRSGTGGWVVYSAPTTSSNILVLNLDSNSLAGSASWNNTSPSSSAFTVGTSSFTNGSGSTFIAYLFATCPGVSKVGSYTGTGTTKDIDCGFTNGARFVLIKRTDSTGDWYVWDTARGIISGNDPYLLLNSTAAEVTSTDYIDPLSSGFQISSTAPAAINANGGSFIYLAIA